MTTPGLRDDGVVYCLGCGQVHDGATALVASLREDVSNTEGELRAKRSRIKALQTEQDRSLRASPHYPDAMAVLEHWRALCAPKAKELRGKRLELVIARLRGKYTREQLEKAVRGYARLPYVVNGKRVSEGTPKEWYADATLIFRSAEHVDRGIRYDDDAAARANGNGSRPPAPSQDALQPLRRLAKRQLWGST